MPETIVANEPLLDVLLEQNLISAGQLEEIVAESRETGKPVRDIVVNMELMAEDELLELIAAHLGTSVINLPATDIPPDVIRSITASVARMYSVVPVEASPDSVTLAYFDMVAPMMMDELMFVLSKNINFVMAREEDVRTFVNQFYGDDSSAVNEMLTALESEIDSNEELVNLTSGEDENAITEAAGSTPVIRFVNLVLYSAVQDRASDIHFEPFETEFKIRYRVDGALYEMTPPPKRLALPVISRLKVLSNLNIAERRLPQDGRIQLPIAGRVIDFRVSCLPTQFGESVVLRVLDRSVVSLELDNLGMPEEVLQGFEEDIKNPNGIIVVTGPTGSGKTTTLYSGLRRINKVETKILTAEQPVEYDIEGIIQIPINDAQHNTFERVLRAFLRQDPDVMMIGEIRDLETAQIAVQASLTGHLVFSTLHTNDSVGAITRLIDMGVEPFLISSTLESILAQRLVRRICEKCKTSGEPTDEELMRMGVDRREVDGREFYRGNGCSHCNNTGYHGRKGLYEYLVINSVIRDLINQRKPSLALRDKAVEMGMRTLRQDGLRNVLDGYTTVEEVAKYT